MDTAHQNAPAGADESGILPAAPDGRLHPLVGRCVSHHHACDCRERAFLKALAVAQDTMEAYATSAELDEWHCRVEDLTGTAYPRNICPPNGQSAGTAD